MAIARGAGTEIIRSHAFEDISTDTHLIIGVQHHIYTVLSFTCRCGARSGTQSSDLWLQGYDAGVGTTDQVIQIAHISIAAGETYVWNDKFSFNGYEPVDFTGPISTIAMQDAIADQGNTGTFPTGSQYLKFDTDGTSTYYDLSITFIDQNNA